MSARWRVVLLLAVTLLVYGNSLRNGFTLDDEAYILQNAQVTGLSMRAIFEPNQFANIFRPVTMATYALQWAVEGDHPLGYHLLNLLLHAAVVVLLYLLLTALLDALPQARTLAFVVALLFAVHPIHTEAVASIVGRSELLAAGFLLGAWLCHLRDRQVSALFCFVLALLSKESAVVFTPVLLAGDYACGKLKPLPRYGWFAGITALYLGLLWNVQGGRFGPRNISFLDNPLANIPASLRILNAFRVAWKYLGLHVFPSVLSCDYSYNSILLFANWRRTLPATAAALLVFALWIWAMWKRRSAWALAGTFYLGGFAVTANVLMPSATILGERLAYFPSAGFCLLAALPWVRLEQRHQKLAWALLALAVSALGGRTIVRNNDWQNNFTLYSSAVKVVPGSAKMHLNLGAEYMYRGQLDEARREYDTALRIYPEYPDAVEWSALLESQRNHDQEALRQFEAALSMMRRDSRNYDFAVINLAAELIKVGNLEEALKLLDKHIAESPNDSRAWSNRAVIHFRRGEGELARKDAFAALRLDSGNSQARNLLGMMGTELPSPRP